MVSSIANPDQPTRAVIRTSATLDRCRFGTVCRAGALSKLRTSPKRGPDERITEAEAKSGLTSCQLLISGISVPSAASDGVMGHKETTLAPNASLGR
ncbi:hypothetical protein JMJ77_0008989 [Colletotrichum scovillei]|uniref:Uncharacterized protein n=1 Tax=Colletotrichum scovillei TaxID=1209932 RepID=A0A9P7QQ42_9PEZI|nr:hypothetical protein JMJ78_0010708 [Colletotrichum scovillei]KAG7040714.1 hypothetical protein JMJ77_0008989 [Colletotrichum scovillei]KAG7060758.1 hypothetical protein JMJ76_0003972 [Colletotrichum scovillei]